MRISTSAFIGCVFLGLSVDGFIARPDGDLSWLTSRGEAAGDAGFTPFVESVDALVMGRATYEVISGETEWPYLGRPVHVLSSKVGSDADPRIIVHASFGDLVAALGAAGYRRVYVDGGRTVRTFLAAGLIDELTLSRVPVLSGRAHRCSGRCPPISTSSTFAPRCSAAGWCRPPELSPRQRTTIVIAAVVQAGLQAAALVDLHRRSARRVRGNKRFWAAASFVNFVGPIAYFARARR